MSISTRYGLNMDSAYENYVRQIARGALSANSTDAVESLEESVERNKQI